MWCPQAEKVMIVGWRAFSEVDTTITLQTSDFALLCSSTVHQQSRAVQRQRHNGEISRRMFRHCWLVPSLGVEWSAPWHRERVWTFKWHQTPPVICHIQKCCTSNTAAPKLFRRTLLDPGQSEVKEEVQACENWWGDCYWQRAVILHFYNRSE